VQFFLFLRELPRLLHRVRRVGVAVAARRLRQILRKLSQHLGGALAGVLRSGRRAGLHLVRGLLRRLLSLLCFRRRRRVAALILLHVLRQLGGLFGYLALLLRQLAERIVLLGTVGGAGFVVQLAHLVAQFALVAGELTGLVGLLLRRLSREVRRRV